MTNSLRTTLVEAGMEALANTDPAMEPPEYGIDELAEACLDAFLDALADRVDEWRDASWEFPAMSTEKRLIAVLRKDTQ